MRMVSENIQSGKIHLVNAKSYFSRPSPRVVEGIEMLADIIHPELFSAPHADDARQWKKPKVVTT